MLRLAPSHPPLWRSPSSIQLGPESVARVDDVAPWQERLLDALVDGIPDAMLLPLAASFGAAPGEADAFLRRIGGALGRVPATAPRVRVEVPEAFGRDETEILLAGLRGGGLDVTGCTAWPVEDGGPRLPVVAVAFRLLDPLRAARLVSRDAPHIPVELAGDRVTVGPLVIPGVTACLACLHAHRRDGDPTWPLVAAQLLARGPVPTEPALLLEAALLAARLVGGGVPGASVTLSGGSVRRSWHAHRPHAACLCRSPAGSGTADAPDARPCAPTTASAFARPA